MAVLVAGTGMFAYSKGKHMEGLVAAKNITLQVLPVLILAFILAGLM